MLLLAAPHKDENKEENITHPYTPPKRGIKTVNSE